MFDTDGGHVIHRTDLSVGDDKEHDALRSSQDAENYLNSLHTLFAVDSTPGDLDSSIGDEADEDKAQARPTISEANEDNSCYAFPLLAQARSVQINLRSPSPPSTTDVTSRSRPLHFYHTAPLSMDETDRLKSCAFSSMDVLRLSNTSWPGSHRPCRVTTFKTNLVYRHPKQTKCKGFSGRSVEGKRLRPNKKRRMLTRMKHAEVVFKEKASKDKRNRRNREKKVKRREKRRLSKKEPVESTTA